MLKKFIKPVIYWLISNLSIVFYKKKNRILPNKITSILVVNLGLIGDGLLITPVITKLQNKYKGEAKISLLVTPWAFTALKNIDGIDKYIYEAFWADPKDNHKHAMTFQHLILTYTIIKKIKKYKFDVIINTWFADQPFSALLLRFLNSGNLIGFDFKYSGKFYDWSNYFDPEKHIIYNLNILINKYFNINSNEDIKYCLPKGYIGNFDNLIKDIQKYILISPFTSELNKSWPLENWETLIEILIDKYPEFNYVLVGTKENANVSKNFIKKLSPKVIDLVGKTTFDDFAVLVKSAFFIISVDSSITHLASAFKVPVFILFSHIYNYKQILPYNSLHSYLIDNQESNGIKRHIVNTNYMRHDPLIVIDKINKFIKAILSSSDKLNYGFKDEKTG